MSHGSSATGLRLAETLITWANVNWSARMITTRGKGGRIISTPITDEVAAILKPLVGHDPEAVFTYVSRRPKSGQHKGERPGELTIKSHENSTSGEGCPR